jgi:hypothetical protein
VVSDPVFDEDELEEAENKTTIILNLDEETE